MKTHTFYMTQSKATNPGIYKCLYDALPTDVLTLLTVTHGLTQLTDDRRFKTEQAASMSKKSLPFRNATDVLGAIISSDGRPLHLPRPPHEQLKSSMLDQAVLMCSILRAKKIPSRLRAGFRKIYQAQLEEELGVQFWCKKTNRWQMLTGQAINSAEAISLHVPLHFIPAAKAWRLFKENRLVPPFNFSREQNHLGRVRTQLLKDMALLNKKENVIHDIERVMVDFNQCEKNQLSYKETQLLDNLAYFLIYHEDNTKVLRDYYRDLIKSKWIKSMMR